MLKLGGELLDDDVTRYTDFDNNPELFDLFKLLLREVVEMANTVGLYGKDFGRFGDLGLYLCGVDGYAQANFSCSQ